MKGSIDLKIRTAWSSKPGKGMREATAQRMREATAQIVSGDDIYSFKIRQLTARERVATRHSYWYEISMKDEDRNYTVKAYGNSMKESRLIAAGMINCYLYRQASIEMMRYVYLTCSEFT